MKCKLVGISENGARVGETHHRAILSDHDVDLIRELAEETVLPDGTTLPGLSYLQIAQKFGIGKSTVRDIIKCRRRWQTPAEWRRVPVDE